MLCIGDTDRDSSYEFIFRPGAYGVHCIYYCELQPPQTWEIDSLYSDIWVVVHACGDFDLDGLSDLIVVGSEGRATLFGILESPDSVSYPNQEVWRDTILIGSGCTVSSFDIDGDSTPEIFGRIGDGLPHGYAIYESIGDNQYMKLYSTTPDSNGYSWPASTHACGDFDGDGKNEFAMGSLSWFGNFWIYESPANNAYEKILQITLPTPNIHDCFTVNDADADGKKEFVAKGFVYLTDIRVFIFEAIANNAYEIIQTFTFPDGDRDYYGGHSDAGDVDGDGVPEIVLESCQHIYIIKAYRNENGYYNDSFYVWQTLPGNATGSSVRVFDLDRNGLNEIIISGNNHTRIYEKTPFVTWFCPEPYDTFWANDTVYPKWKLDETISLDSLRLYWSRPQMGCRLIYQGLPTDTICQWVVPDTPSNFSNRLWLVVKGNGRYDSTSSPVFYIKRHTGVEETKISQSAIRNPKFP
ncbi:MAG: VCBS repeat-containing protein [candidate division WOR-3 bacterium]